MNETEPRDPFGFEDLHELPGAEHILLPGETRKDYFESQADIAERTLRATNRNRIEVKCDARGCYSGTFVSRTGRSVGPCFSCNSKGTITRAANYEHNKKLRETRAEKRAAEEQAHVEADRQRRIDAFKVSRPDLAAWLAASDNDFAMSLRETVATYGNLSVAQEAAVLKSIGRDHLEESRPAEGDLDVSSLRGYYAVPDCETRLKLAVRHPGKHSKYHGWVFVDDGAAYGSRRTYGKQAPGAKYRGKMQEQLRAILADPHAAQVACGRLTGVCGVCGRTLEDAESVAAGIGPICAARGQ